MSNTHLRQHEQLPEDRAFPNVPDSRDVNINRHQETTHGRLSSFAEIGAREIAQQRSMESPVQRTETARHHPHHHRPEHRPPEFPGLEPVSAYSESAFAVPQESMPKAALEAAAVTASVAAVAPVYFSSVLEPTAKMTFAGAIPSGMQLATVAGLPLAGAAAGYYLGKKLKHPLLGSVAGTGAGAVGAMYALPLIQGSLNASIAGMTSTAALSALASSAAIAGGVGAGLYGLGRLHGKLWDSKPAGLLKTMGRGLVSPLSVPLGLVRKAIR